MLIFATPTSTERTTTRPVTHTADVAVNSASRRVAPPGPALAIGNVSSTVPTATADPKPTTTTCAGCRSSGKNRLARRPRVLRRCGASPSGTRETLRLATDYDLRGTVRKEQRSVAGGQTPGKRGGPGRFFFWF